MTRITSDFSIFLHYLIKALFYRKRLAYEIKQNELYNDILLRIPLENAPSRQVIEDLENTTVLSKQDIIELLLIGVTIDEILDKSRSDNNYCYLSFFKRQKPSVFYFLNC